MYSCVLLCRFVNTQMKKSHHNTPVLMGRDTFIKISTVFIHRKSQSGSLAAVYHYNKTKTQTYAEKRRVKNCLAERSVLFPNVKSRNRLTQIKKKKKVRVKVSRGKNKVRARLSAVSLDHAWQSRLVYFAPEKCSCTWCG